MDPKDWLKAELSRRKLTPRLLAEAIGCKQQRIHELANGRKRITPRWAILLGRALTIAPAVVLEIQSDYDLMQEFEQNVELFNKVRAA